MNLKKLNFKKFYKSCLFRWFILIFLLILVFVISFFVSFLLMKYWVFKLLTFIGLLGFIAELGFNFDKYFPPKNFVKVKYKDINDNPKEAKIIINKTNHYIN